MIFSVLPFATSLAGIALWRRYRLAAVAFLAVAAVYTAIGWYVRDVAIRSFDASAATALFVETIGFPAALVQLEPYPAIREFPRRARNDERWNCESVRVQNAYHHLTNFTNKLLICSKLDGSYALGTNVITPSNDLALFGQSIWTAPAVSNGPYRYFAVNMDYPCDRARSMMGLYGARGDYRRQAVWDCGD
ncbi:hypothetical protein ACLNGM_03400 [Aureimonas phyllosphaerae]|uniref:hypothetical protein n=1 Tax=Aureimonas phyllosphaerae TaxID=1166078 RepID=UPI003A5C1D24